MTVSELIAHLQTLPQDQTVHFRGYSCGSVWHAPVRKEDFVEALHMKSTDRIVEIAADWN